MKIALVNGASAKSDAVRGIGVNTNELLKSLLGIIKNNVIITETTKKSNLYLFDVVHFTSFRPFFITLPFIKPKNTKFILTIHDLIPLVYPNVYKTGIRGKINFMINKIMVGKYVDEIITISETSKKDICRFLGVSPEKVHVIYLAAKKIFKKVKVTKKYNLPKKFVLYTGDINYNKNIPNLIKACEIAKIPLVIAGKQALEIENMDLNHSELIHLKGLSLKNVTRLGFVSDEDLNDLYNLASVYIQPSLYEGFGLPLLEALAAGCPIVSSKNQAQVEILGDDADYVDPYDISSMAKGILNPNKKINLPRDYSWEKAARETLEVYEKFR